MDRVIVVASLVRAAYFVMTTPHYTRNRAPGRKALKESKL